MFLNIQNILLAVFLTAAPSLCQQNDCIIVEYASSTSDTVYKCREGCVGTVPNCVPDCDNGCPVNSRCTSPNVCECNPGYIKDESNPNVVPSLKSCKANCEISCPPFSHCVSYQNCECNEGYIESVTNPDVVPSLQSCKPLCDTTCPRHSHCDAPNSCVCDKGFTTDRINLNVVPSLESCREIKEDSFSGLQIVIYSLLVCSLIFITIAGVSMLIIWVKRSNSDLPKPTQEESWHTSFASYTANEKK